MFQPIDPGSENNEALVAYKLAKNKWCRAPAQVGSTVSTYVNCGSKSFIL